MSEHFRYRIDNKFAPLWLPFGVRPSKDGVTLTDDGLTFGTNHDAGVCIHFHKKVRSVLRRSGHSALTVTVADVERLIDALDGKTRNNRSDR